MNTDVATLNGYEAFEEPTFIAVEFEERGPLTEKPRAMMYRACVIDVVAPMCVMWFWTEWTLYASVAQHEGTAMESDLRWEADPRSAVAS